MFILAWRIWGNHSPGSRQGQGAESEGKWCIYKGDGLKARCFCHEIDHLDGILFTERLAPEASIQSTVKR